MTNEYIDDENNMYIANTLKKSMQIGISGSGAMFVQVATLMWLRTTVNYQYRHGLSTTEAFRILYRTGGIKRFYSGVSFAFILAPVSKFGDIAWNSFVIDYLTNNKNTNKLPLSVKTFISSLFASSWRVLIFPLDTCKSMKQVEGRKGMIRLKEKIRVNGIRVLYHGGSMTFANTLVSHFPWFFTYHTLNNNLPESTSPYTKFSRRAVIGFFASSLSATCSNCLKILKTYKQTSREVQGYASIFKKIYNTEGLSGILGRGLKTRILANGAQGIVFTVVWKSIEEYWI
eukprot:TRINITY_DN6945_c0_g1_i1.p2 TRINITY_DN6945_c0_g1~~TRINITY_DN6945_c0_g1_i1.p2  ORF type:complete len:287 (-),score=30.22 TRINITY_DN6945_c0_g1_i1:100-960(-)